MTMLHTAHPAVISAVLPLEGKRLRLIFSTGSELILNMENRLNTVRFFPLRDDKVFNSVKTDGFSLQFEVRHNCALDFSLYEALRMAACSPGEYRPGV